jgi:hypothetical protein
MNHRCHAIKCTVEVPLKLLMCKKHWAMVPPQLKADIWTHYRPGQERDKRPSVEYLQAMRSAIRAVLDVERGIKYLPIARVDAVLGGEFVPAACDLCGKVEELRPYGPHGENVCFTCGMKNEEAAKQRFRQITSSEGQ